MGQDPLAPKTLSNNELASSPQLKSGEIAHQFDDLLSLTDLLTDAVSALEDKLYPILRSEPPIESDAAEPVMETQVGKVLFTTNERLRVLNLRINGIRQRTEL